MRIAKLPRQSRRLLHTSDLHMTSLHDKNCRDLHLLGIAARKTEADLVIIAGDLFDSHRVQDDLVAYVASELQNFPAQVVILPGNHDCLIPESAYERSGLWKDCPNVRIMRAPAGELLALSDLGISLWGKPAMSYDEDIRPLAGIPQPNGTGHWHIAIAHGYYVKSYPPRFPSYNISREEIVNSGWDYIALGHLITFDCVCREPVAAYYSGSPSASGGFAAVDLDEETGIKVSQYPLAAGIAP